MKISTTLKDLSIHQVPTQSGKKALKEMNLRQIKQRRSLVNNREKIITPLSRTMKFSLRVICAGTLKCNVADYFMMEINKLQIQPFINYNLYYVAVLCIEMKTRSL